MSGSGGVGWDSLPEVGGAGVPATQVNATDTAVISQFTSSATPPSNLPYRALIGQLLAIAKRFVTYAAAGNNQGTATPISAPISLIASGTGGVILTPPTDGSFTGSIKPLNRTGVTINVYPPVGAQIENLGTNVADSVVNIGNPEYLQVSATLWRSI
jgi:hypothetical protein